MSKYNHLHGGYQDKLYDTWQDMKMKCNWPEHRLYHNHGGKGIKVCDKWLDNYAAFKQFALNHGYTDDMYLHRLDKNRDFEPDNIYFSYENPNSKYLIYNGERKTQVEWARERGIKKQTLSARLKRGWTIGQALEFEPRQK